MKQILRAKVPLNIITGYSSLRYPRGSDIMVAKGDFVDEEGWHLRRGDKEHLVPRSNIQILTVHTPTITSETLVDEDGKFVETREEVRRG